MKVTKGKHPGNAEQGPAFLLLWEDGILPSLERMNEPQPVVPLLLRRHKPGSTWRQGWELCGPMLLLAVLFFIILSRYFTLIINVIAIVVDYQGQDDGNRTTEK